MSGLESPLPNFRNMAGISVNDYKAISSYVSVAGTRDGMSLLETYYGLQDVCAVVNLIEGLLERVNA